MKHKILYIFVILNLVSKLNASCSYIGQDGSTRFVDEGGLVVSEKNGEFKISVCSGGNFSSNSTGAQTQLYLALAQQGLKGYGCTIGLVLIGSGGKQTGFHDIPVDNLDHRYSICTPKLPPFTITYDSIYKYLPDFKYYQLRIGANADFSKVLGMQAGFTMGIRNNPNNNGGENDLSIMPSYENLENSFEIKNDAIKNYIYYQIRPLNKDLQPIGSWTKTMIVSRPILRKASVDLNITFKSQYGASLYKIDMIPINKVLPPMFSTQFFPKVEPIRNWEITSSLSTRFINCTKSPCAITELFPNRSYYYTVCAYDKNNNILTEPKFLYSYLPFSYRKIEFKPKPEESYFYTNIINDKRVYSWNISDPTKPSPAIPHLNINQEFITWKRIPGAFKYEIQYSLGIPLPESLPFENNIQFEGVLEGARYPSIGRIFIHNQQNVNLTKSGDLLPDEDYFQFKFPKYLDGNNVFELSNSNPLYKLKIFYRVRGIDANNKPIELPTQPAKLIKTESISFDLQNKLVFWDPIPNATSYLIDVVSDISSFTRLPSVGLKSDLSSSSKQVQDLTEIDGLTNNYVSRNIVLNTNNLMSLCAYEFANLLNRYRVGNDVFIKSNFTMTDLFGSNLFDFCLNFKPIIYNLSDLAGKFKSYGPKINFNGIKDCSTGGCKINNQGVFTNNGSSGRFAIEFDFETMEPTWSNKVKINSGLVVPQNNSNLRSALITNLAPNEWYYWRIIGLDQYGNPIGNWSETNSFRVGKTPNPDVDTGWPIDIPITEVNKVISSSSKAK